MTNITSLTEAELNEAVSGFFSDPQPMGREVVRERVRIFAIWLLKKAEKQITSREPSLAVTSQKTALARITELANRDFGCRGTWEQNEFNKAVVQVLSALVTTADPVPERRLDEDL